MKATALLLLVFLFGKSCSSDTKNDIKTAVIEYTANTRGFYQKTVIRNQTVSFTKDRSAKAIAPVEKISDPDWKELVDAFQDVSLDEIPDLKSPTEKRFYDGAAIAILKITYKGKTYESQAFDHLTPPVEIEKLVDKIVSFAKEEE